MHRLPAVDANIILRFLTNDDPLKAEACAALLERIECDEARFGFRIWSWQTRFGHWRNFTE